MALGLFLVESNVLFPQVEEDDSNPCEWYGNAKAKVSNSKQEAIGSSTNTNRPDQLNQEDPNDHKLVRRRGRMEKH